MMVTRKIVVFSLLVVAALFIQNAAAVPTEKILPESSHYEGSTSYNVMTDDGVLRGRIDFAVYDGPAEFEVTGDFTAPGSGRYIYAYQIFNDTPISDEAVGYFAVFGILEASLAVDEGSIGSQDDKKDGVEPTKAYFTSSNLRGVWEFHDQTGAILDAGEHSHVLVFSSDKNWVPGRYEIRTVPEPGMIALLGIGGAIMFMRRRKSV